MVYPVTVSFPGIAVQNHPMDQVVGCDLLWRTADGKEIVMLLGRDLLRHFLMVYNGMGSDITLAY